MTENIWVTTSQTPASEEEKEERLKENKGLPTVTVLSKVSLRALKIDPSNGKIIKDIEVFEKKQLSGFINLTAMPSSPFLEDGKLYLHFGALVEMHALIQRGKIIWKNDEKNLWVMHENGPVVHPQWKII